MRLGLRSVLRGTAAAAVLVCSRRGYRFATTPVFYTNDEPHVGHLYTALLGDFNRRWELVKDDFPDPQFAAGTDEHGVKIATAAKRAGRPPELHVAHNRRKFIDMFARFGVQPTVMVHTSDERHKQAVQDFWKGLYHDGHIYKATYSGWYSIIDECFYTDDQVDQTTDPPKKCVKKLQHICAAQTSLSTGNPVAFTMSGTAAQFRLSALHDDVFSWLQQSDAIYPAQYLSAALAQLRAEDVSVSRVAERVQGWGVPVPGDEKQIIYVWFDALINYLTASGYPLETPFWPPDCYIIGKDIIRFHAILWPAMLLAAGKQPPLRLHVHGHWLVDGEKMSKSKGNVVTPNEAAAVLGEEGLRYFLLRQATPHDDNKFDYNRAAKVLNSELANQLGNLLSRSITHSMNPSQRYPSMDWPTFDKYFNPDGKLLLANLNELADSVVPEYDKLLVSRGVDQLFDSMRLANAFFQNRQPWNYAEAGVYGKYISSTLSLTYEALRIYGILLAPVVPELAGRLLNRLGVPYDQRKLVHARPFDRCPVSRQDTPLGRDDGVHFFNRLPPPAQTLERLAKQSR